MVCLFFDAVCSAKCRVNMSLNNETKQKNTNNQTTTIYTRCRTCHVNFGISSIRQACVRVCVCIRIRNRKTVWLLKTRSAAKQHPKNNLPFASQRTSATPHVCTGGDSHVAYIHVGWSPTVYWKPTIARRWTFFGRHSRADIRLRRASKWDGKYTAILSIILITAYITYAHRVWRVCVCV